MAVGFCVSVGGGGFSLSLELESMVEERNWYETPSLKRSSEDVIEPSFDGCRLFDLVVEFGWTGV